MGLLTRVIRRLRHKQRELFGQRRARRELPMVERAYETELGRPIDAGARVSWRHRIARGEISGAEAAAELRTSPEYVLWRSGFYDRLNGARMRWAENLDSFETILDIGGSSPTCPDGALIELGYSHRPKELLILDRPEDEQFFGRPGYDQRIPRVTDWGTITFHHGYAEDVAAIAALADRRFDAIFMGQTIEHIEVHRLRDVLAFIREHLAPGGRFIFDTPNRALTKLIMGDLYLSHDHTYEYEPREMADLLLRHGFRITRRTGLIAMPKSLATGEFDATESATGWPLVDDDVDNCFVFAFECTPA